MGQSPGDVYVPRTPWAGQVGQPLLSLLCCSSPGGHMVQNKEISLLHLSSIHSSQEGSPGEHLHGRCFPFPSHCRRQGTLFKGPLSRQYLEKSGSNSPCLLMTMTYLERDSFQDRFHWRFWTNFENALRINIPDMLILG